MLEHFALKLVAGIAIIWLWMPRKDVTDGFFRIQMLVALGLCVLVALTVQPVSPVVTTPGSYRSQTVSDSANSTGRSQRTTDLIRIAQVIAAVIAYLGHIVWKLGRRVPGTIAIYAVAGLCLISLLFSSFGNGFSVDALHWLLSDLVSCAVLGATLTGMLLGHWYLTTPTMSISPLSWFVRCLLLAAIGRLLLISLALFRFGFGSHDLVHVLWLSVRVVGGVLVPFVTALMVFRILRFRNTQSATGVLFAALILVFMGEISAALLARDLKIPY
ncbi:MAG: hypothetical protein KDB01_05925 [Planctomycetaceae bacterium]|nr:hypothetical protein [Planctomycetaceae bacterium]